jgi:dTDP-4-dehydrorhamnose reductase
VRLRRLSQLPSRMVIRISFGHSPFPYPVAPTTFTPARTTSRVPASDIALALQHLHQTPYPTLRIATERKSVYELARRTSASVTARSKVESTVALPDDISLNTERWGSLPASLRRKSGGG